ncbi:MAG: FAD-dependent oxidoreductase [Anaerolineae bacterium]|nr:FAD-dependent oxidoreductase [Anaerolineae bacterium]
MTNNGREKNKTVVGAVMVVGGGIAGMQASLDLAEAGYRVNLVENKSAIGGHMAQLDKTFPTNDCSICTISPKLVEVGGHRNIKLMTNTEVLDIKGQAGDFTVTVRHNPRYIDPVKCTGCGDCAKVCPIILPDHFNEGLSERRAAYKLYPQAMPNAYAIEKRGVAPCRNACPAGQRAQGYIALINAGRYADAMRVIKEDNPFPGICGRICNHRCEDACNRGQVEEPLNIRALKRFVTDWVYEQPRVLPDPVEQKYAERVAVIGAGPCGLTAAQDLRRLGYGVTVFESLPVAGGMLRVGVPEFRLPAEIVEREVRDIVDLGVDLRLNTRVDNLDDIFAEGFQAVLVAVGAHKGVKLSIKGRDLAGVLVNMDFLRNVRLGAPPNFSGKRVMVLGGGNVALDVARTSVRLGAAEVRLACLEEKEKMPAHAWEVEDAEAEGVIIQPARSFKQILDNGRGEVGGLECLRVNFMEFDEEGRLTLETEPGSEHVIPCDIVIFSVGQRAELAFIPKRAGVEVTKRSTVAVDPHTLAAGRPGVFAAGDAVTGTTFVIEAVAGGHNVAQSIHRYLRGQKLEPPAKPDLPVVEMSRAEIQERLHQGEIKIEPRVAMPVAPVAERRQNFEEVEQGYTEEQARAEAARCLACGICSECLSCSYECKAGAINHDEPPRIEQVQVGAVVLAPGYQIYQAELSEEYGLGRYPNVVTALQFERLLSASGPTHGHVTRPSDGKPARKIAFLQCVGSRDQSHDYCSAVCCMYAAKEAVMAREHDPEAEVTIFFMDMRAYSKGYEAYYRRAEERYGIRYVRCRISAAKEDPQTGNLLVRYLAAAEGNGHERGPEQVVEESFDMAVLSVGMEISPQVRALGRKLGIQLDDYGFCHTTQFNPLETSRRGVYAVGPFREPKDIPESVMEASGAAALAGGLLAPARGTLISPAEYPPERDVGREEPRIGVFVCHCGSNIGGFLDVPGVAAYAQTLPHVVHAEDNLYTCSQDSIKRITEKTIEFKLNRVVVASCTPLTHEPLFQDSIRQAGLNPYLFDMANIRNQCSWVHGDDFAGATLKAKELVRMTVARAAELKPLHRLEVPVTKRALVIGGGLAGMQAALALAQQEVAVDLVEREAALGGNLRHVRFLPELSGSKDQTRLQWRDAQAYLQDLIAQVNAAPGITVRLQTQHLKTDGYKGNFTSTLRAPEGEVTVQHGATIVAVGAQEYRGPDYGYGSNPHILTQQEFEAQLAGEDLAGGDLADVNSVVMIQCVGPAEQHCSRTCCTIALKNALKLKELNPAAQVTILYRDVRTYGFKERLYTEARRAGVLFVRYEAARKPQVNQPAAGPLEVQVWEPMLGREMVLRPDRLVLSMPMVPAQGVKTLANRLKVGVDLDGWLMEAHVKLRPVDFSTEGFYMAGAAHYPKLLDETITQAQAAAARAATILSRDSLEVGGIVAQVRTDDCVGCLTCVRTCPFGVPQIKFDLTGVGNIAGAAFIEPAICQGCGTCAAACPAKAIDLRHYTDAQVLPKVDALFAPACLIKESVQ